MAHFGQTGKADLRRLGFQPDGDVEASHQFGERANSLACEPSGRKRVVRLDRNFACIRIAVGLERPTYVGWAFSPTAMWKQVTDPAGGPTHRLANKADANLLAGCPEISPHSHCAFALLAVCALAPATLSG